MTKQNTHFEHDDVDISVVEHSSASKTNSSSSSSETAQSAGEAVEAFAALPGADTHNLSEEQATHHTPQERGQSFGQENQSVRGEPSVDSQAGTETSIVMPVETPIEAPLGPSIADALVVEEEVRPFTDFIEEFRQAEGRFNSSLQAYQTESHSLHAAGVEDSPVGSEQDVSAESKVDDVGPQFVTSGASPTGEQAEEKKAQLPGENIVTETAVVIAAERPVSPLLRPASRQRPQRHGGGRHREEQPVEKVAPPETDTPKEAAGEAKVESAVTDPASLEEQPRPARRYRFDRPAPTAINAPPVPSLTAAPASPSQAQSHGEENKDAANRGTTPVPALSTRLENERVTNGQTGEKEVQTKQRTSGIQLPEQDTQKKQPVVKEVATEEGNPSSAPVTAPAQEHDRGRRDRQRSKEQSPPALVVPAAPVVEVAPITVEPVPSQQKEEVSPEDLPPLEYAELQKASSRRRRRRHTGSAVPAAATPGVTKAPAAEVSAAAPQMPLVLPRTPANAAAPANQHTITSGYTVSQMNQNRDGSNPFMGPEPSPARGSIAAQNTRSIRTDVQRIPAYPVRTTEATSASVHQLASIVSQAIQTQTDRMVAELRHANQAPTNISVSMPPFPSSERVGVFVDVANLLYSARTLRMAVDFGKLLDFLRGNRRLIRAHAYCPTSPQPGDEQMFLQAVKGLGYRITTKNYKTFSSGAKKADLDLDLCMDVVRLVDGKAVDCIVLVSGDSDFMPMLDYCSDHGVRVEVAAFDEAMSATLRQSCDLFINLSMLDEIRV